MKRLVVILILILSLLNSTPSPGRISGQKSGISLYFLTGLRLIAKRRSRYNTGKTVLKLSSLSPYIDVQSIQVKGFGDFTILSVNHQNNWLQNLEDSPEVKSIRSQIEELQRKVEDEKASISVLKEKAAFLVANREVLVKSSAFSMEQFKNLMDMYTKNMEQVTVTSLMKERLIKDYEKQIAAPSETGFRKA